MISAWACGSQSSSNCEGWLELAAERRVSGCRRESWSYCSQSVKSGYSNNSAERAPS
ncbi:hypothetical protein BCV70DRAFT_200819 [Testicularia cyperi]|uniref:Uncharacterized protein n=1 Tax=Testicularia cyperi TaxID=1882483 RepID=A0A317XNQ0_9BASI|nr:hypothetical protein BCV70DRAFT_200819 [Testicularia cyperi]